MILTLHTILTSRYSPYWSIFKLLLSLSKYSLKHVVVGRNHATRRDCVHSILWCGVAPHHSDVRGIWYWLPKELLWNLFSFFLKWDSLEVSSVAEHVQGPGILWNTTKKRQKPTSSWSVTSLSEVRISVQCSETTNSHREYINYFPDSFQQWPDQLGGKNGCYINSQEERFFLPFQS